MDVGVQLMQPVEVGGQRRARIDVAEATLLGARAELQATRAEVAARTRRTFAGVLGAQAQLRAAEEASAFGEKAVLAVRQRLAAGGASQIDVNAALVEFGRARRDVIVARQALISRTAELSGLLVATPEFVPEPAGELGAVVAQLVIEVPDVEVATARALEARADLAAARADVTVAQTQMVLSSRSAVPTPALGLAYEREGAEQVVQGLLALELPLFDRNQAERGSAAAQLKQAQVRAEALERRIRIDVRAALENLDAARAGVALFREGINQAAQDNVKLIEAGYLAGKLDFFQLLLMQRNAVESRRGYVESLEELASAAAELRRVLGDEGSSGGPVSR